MMERAKTKENKIFCEIVDWRRIAKPHLQQGPLKDALITADLQHGTSRMEITQKLSSDCVK